MSARPRFILPALLQRRPRSRQYLSKYPDRRVLRALFEAARWSHSSRNSQPWRYVVLTDSALREKIHAALAQGNEWVKKAPILIALYSAPTLDDNLNGRAYYLYDTGGATMALTLAALERGIIVNQIAGFDEQGAAQILGIRPPYRVIVLLAIGYPEPGSEQGAQRSRQAQDAFVFGNRAGTPFSRKALTSIRHRSAGGIVLVGQKRIVLVENLHSGIVTFPKGHVEAGESPHAAARREIQEETGFIKLKMLRYLATQRYAYVEGCLHQKELLLYLFRADPKKRVKPIPGREKLKAHIVSISQARTRLSFASQQALLGRITDHDFLTPHATL